MGYTTPDEFGALIRGIREHTPGIEKAIISVHCHNDLGLAVANSLAGVRAGARQVECTINGLGERAGNAALEEIVMALLHAPLITMACSTGIDTTEIYPTSRMVSNYTGLAVQANKAIVGANAFAHEAGIHQDGILKNRLTYEIMDAQMVGVPREHAWCWASTRAATPLLTSWSRWGIIWTTSSSNRPLPASRNWPTRKRWSPTRDLEAIVSDEVFQPQEVYRLEQLQVSCGDHAIATATVRLRAPDGAIVTDAAHGTGPVDAVYKAINRIVGVPNELTEFSVNAVTEGIDAVGEVTIRIEAEANGDERPAGEPADGQAHLCL